MYIYIYNYIYIYIIYLKLSKIYTTCVSLPQSSDDIYTCIYILYILYI